MKLLEKQKAEVEKQRDDVRAEIMVRLNVRPLHVPGFDAAKMNDAKGAAVSWELGFCGLESNTTGRK